MNVVREESLAISFADVSPQSTNGSNIIVGSRNIDFFFDPNNFPVECDGDVINLYMKWTDSSTNMTVQIVEGREPVTKERSIDVSEMEDWQKSIAFLYLIGVLTNES